MLIDRIVRGSSVWTGTDSIIMYVVSVVSAVNSNASLTESRR